MTANRPALLFCLFAPLLYAASAVLLFDQDANWDLRNYHYYNAFAFLEGGRDGDLLAANRASFYNPLIDVPFYLADRFLPARLTGFLLGLIQGLNLPLLFLLAHRLLTGLAEKPRLLWSAALAVVGMTGGGALGEIGAVFYDNIVSLGLLGALLLIAATADRLRQGKLGVALAVVFLAGAMVGSAFGLKQPWVTYCVGVCFALPLLGASLRRSFFLCFACGLGVLAGFALFGGFWAWHLATLTGNPLFPYFNNLFHAPWAPASEFRDTTFLPQTLADYLLRPFQILVNPLVGGEALFRAPALPLFYLLLPLCLPFGWGTGKSDAAIVDKRLGLYLTGAALLSYLVWLKLFGIYRYLIGVEMLAPLLIASLLDRLPLTGRLKQTALGLGLLASMALTQPGYWVRAPWSPRYVEVQAPPLDKPGSTAVFFASGEPTSYLIPFFDRDIRWLRLDGGFPGPTPKDQPFNAYRMEKIRNLDRDRLFVLLLPKDRAFVGSILALYGLDFAESPCLTVTSNLMPAPYALCPLAVARGQEH